MKKSTLIKIIESSIETFSKDSYGKASIAQICKNAEVSNGIIYSYFKNKEELFKYLLEETSQRIEEQFKHIKGNTIQERLESFILLNIDITQKEFNLIKVYREGQYKFIEYEQKLRKVYLKALNFVYKRDLEELEYLFIMSGIRYINVNFVKRNLEVDEKFFAKILLNGFFNSSKVEISEFQNINFYIKTLFNINNKRNNLLQIGEELFGKNNYYEVSINDISKRANIAVGSFYHFYKNKELFFREIVENLDKTTISLLEDNIQKGFNETDNHILFLFLLLEFYGKSPYKYEFIRQSEFIAGDMILKYHNSLENLYIRTMEKLDYNYSEKRIISSHLIGISHYMGIEFFFTENIKDKFMFLEKMKKYFSTGIKE